MITGLWTLVLAGLAWADWRQRSVALYTLVGITLLTILVFPPWHYAAAWEAAAITWGIWAGYVGLRRLRPPHPVIWGGADYTVASLTVLWMHGVWLSVWWMTIAAFGVQLLVTGVLGLCHRPVPTPWPWLVGFSGVWLIWHAVPGVH